jgi:GH24 family phage-related lysozyme (muramidase)
MMDIEILKKELIEDEGCKYEIYLDHLGYKTFGIGHLCKATDPENDLEVGSEVSRERVDECFLNDIEKVIEDCIILYDDFYTLPDEAQLIVANMMFNLGRPRLTNFIRMRKAVNEGNFAEAKIQMLDSKWAKQVPNRAERLSERMGNIT